jgi:uncharacterized membrane protein
MDEDNSADKPDVPSAENVAENPTQKQLQELLNRVGYLERVLREQLSRTYEIEMRLGLAPEPFRPQHPMQQKPQPIPRPLAPQFQQPPQQPFQQPTAQQQPPASAQAPQQKQPQQAGQPLVPPQTSPTSLSIPRQASEQQTQAPRPQQQRPTAQSVQIFGQYATATSNAPKFQSSPSKGRDDLETRIGGSWFNIIGVVAIVFGVGFFLKYAFDNGWITPLYRVITGLFIGFAFLAAGEWLRKKYASYAYGLTGGGILILYLSAWSSFRLYDLFPQKTVFIFMALITALASLLAARYNTLIIAILGLIGGFLTPILLSTGVDNEAGLFGYITLLNLGVLALAFTKQWRSLNYLSFAATVLMVAAWLGEWYEPAKLWTTVIFLTIFFAIFALLAVLYNVVNKRPTGWLDLGLVFINAILYFSTTYLLLNDAVHAGKYHAYLGGFALLMSAFYGLLGYFTYSQDREDSLLILTFGGLAALFLVLAVPIQFDQQWVTMAWALEGAIMTWIGLRVKDRTSLYAALCIFGIAAFHWLIIDAPQFAYEAGKSFTPLLNNRALSAAVLVASLAAAAWFYKRFGEHLKAEERLMFNGMYLLGANLFAITLLSLDVNDYFEQRRAATDLSLTDVRSQLNNKHMFTLTALWALYGAAALFVGLTRKLKIIRIAALLLLAVTALKTVTADLFFYNATWHKTIFNPTFASFAVVIAALTCGAWLYSRSENISENERKLILPMLIAAANIFALIAMSAEAIGHFNRALITNSSLESLQYNRLEEAKQFTLSVLWTLYGAAALTLGIKRSSKLLRIGGMILLAFTTAKLIAINLTYYNAAWHTPVFNQMFGAFALMIAAFALSAWLYAKSEIVEGEERFGVIPVLIVVANLLALVAFSAEAWGHYEKIISAMDFTADNFRYDQLRDLHLAQQLSLSVIWTIYGGVMLTIGIVRRSQLLRIMALLLLSLTILKVFFVDLSSLEKLYRIISFIVLGVILLAVSFLYQRFRFLFVVSKDDDDETPEKLSDISET